MEQLNHMPTPLMDIPRSYCPGCTHGIIHRLVAEVIEEMDLLQKAIIVLPVGCSTLAVDYFAFDSVQSAHGRAPAVATGVKRALPDRFVMTYQGDGDLASIGAAEMVHAATRGELITTIFVNNGIYGMTGGQMAPTSLMGWKTETSPYGRTAQANGYPIRVSEMLAQLNGPAYIARTDVVSVPGINKTKAAIKKAFTAQIKGLGYSIVEILSTCPTNWGMTPVDALKRVKEETMKYYPLGEFKVAEGL
ncbi:MAG TPA: thiamine pyrophosphate-dependent enzyme [Caldisericia bacterium]|nr:MAG: 2-oxoglutarate oxidoreductase subunit KorB [bacterium ADurb.Bin132]HNY61492.1 thiamine pyrophosphate-dependent enzyme [Caldisericia bacterium]HOC80123.1 thiamine pyrophosphate-dependent enzyme [Caldisericia bacterium]HOG70574.1 thiamine pyrophosphate-dependent enzyme [Caldisericia bacterium]HPA65167.1 thiamine pyrophosphate-dependent enzyme [Caldisericia bacterium]